LAGVHQSVIENRRRRRIGMMDLALKFGHASQARPARTAAADPQASMMRGLAIGIALSVPMWILMGFLIFLLT